jgi:hypothetical protein
LAPADAVDRLAPRDTPDDASRAASGNWIDRIIARRLDAVDVSAEATTEDQSIVRIAIINAQLRKLHGEVSQADPASAALTAACDRWNEFGRLYTGEDAKR